MKSVHGDFQLPNVQAQDDTQSIVPCDLVIITLKVDVGQFLANVAQHAQAIAETLAHSMPEGLVADQLARTYGIDRLLQAPQPH